MAENVSVSLGQIKQVAALSIAMGTALVYGEVRIRLMEHHKVVYEKIAISTKQKAVQNEKDLAVVEARISSYIEQQRFQHIARLNNDR